MSKYVIIHGQLHELSDDELMHWKYIKREKVGDKWKYYYEDPNNKKPTNTLVAVNTKNNKVLTNSPKKVTATKKTTDTLVAVNTKNNKVLTNSPKKVTATKNGRKWLERRFGLK